MLSPTYTSVLSDIMSIYTSGFPLDDATSYAPKSYPEPCGLDVPSKSVATCERVLPESFAREFDFNL